VRFGICTANFGSWADPRLAMRVASAAEQAGWDGFFVWDHLSFVWGPPSGDAWVLLAAAATATKRLTLGSAVTPVPRRRPQVLAQTVSTVAALNEGRVVFGAGLGGNRSEFETFGESYDRERRLSLLDDGLELMSRLWEGRIPIWVGGNGPDLLERAARYEGWIANSAGKDGMTMSPEDVRGKARGLREVAVNGYSDAGDVELVRSYEAAGATWWLENLHDMRGSPDDLLRRVEAGPAR
jgi:alkanesulfonate monooxygenase SsuD/methylene tetrahydromethanopterin reductase-like flavin-dependent oxidoreductase (luciferase family)